MLNVMGLFFYNMCSKNPFYEDYKVEISKLKDYNAFICYVCHKTIDALKWYRTTYMGMPLDPNISFHEECLDIRKLKFTHQPYDSNVYARYCIACPNIIDKTQGFFAHANVRICAKCYGLPINDFVNSMKSNNKEFIISDPTNYKSIITEYYDRIPINVVIPTTIKLPDVLTNTPFKIQGIVNLAIIKSISYDVDTICDYYCITPFEHFSTHDCETFSLAVNCSVDSPKYGSVVSIMKCDDGMLSFDNIYDNVNEFYEEYNLWLNDTDIDKSKLLNKNFGCYIRNKKKLGLVDY